MVTNSEVTRVLYMEDDPVMARAAQIRLGRLGYRTDIAPDGEAGLEMGRTGNYHLLLVDNMMPVRTGLDVVQILASEGLLPPTILVTGNGSEQVAVEAMRLGVRDYVSKGASSYLEQLVAVVDRVVAEQRLIAEHKHMQDELRQERDLLSSIMQTSIAAIVLMDSEGRIVFANDRAERVLGVSKSEAEQRLYNSPEWRITDYDGNPLPDQDLPFRRVLDSGESVFELPIAIEWPNQTRKCLLVNGAPLRDESGAITRIVCQVSDVTERVLAQRDMAWKAQIDAAIVSLSSELLAEHISLEGISTHALAHAMRLTQSRLGCVSYIDPDTGYISSHRLSCNDPAQTEAEISPEHLDTIAGLRAWALARRQPVLTNAAGRDAPSSSAPDLRDSATPAPRRFAAVPAWLGDHMAGQIAVADSSRDYDQRDLDLLTRLASVYVMGLRRKWDEDRLVYLSTHDGLTGLYNRSYFERQMSQMAQSGQATVAIAVVDVDNMKSVNDSQGHAAGDELLRRAARMLKLTFRAEDVVARIGGDEFAILVPDARIPELNRIAARVQEQVAHDNAQRADMPLSFSFGIAAGRPGQSLADVLKQADASMYEDKASRKSVPPQGDAAVFLLQQSEAEHQPVAPAE